MYVCVCAEYCLSKYGNESEKICHIFYHYKSIGELLERLL